MMMLLPAEINYIIGRILITAVINLINSMRIQEITQTQGGGDLDVSIY